MSLTRKTAAAVGAAVLPLLSILILSDPATAFAAGAPAPAPGPVPGGGRLVVTVNDGAGRLKTYELVCGPDGTAEGTHPEAAAACERLKRIGGPTGPVTEGQMCPTVYGGAQTASVTGTWGPAAVRERYSRTNGCEIERWRSMVPVLPGDVTRRDGDAMATGAT